MEKFSKPGDGKEKKPHLIFEGGAWRLVTNEELEKQKRFPKKEPQWEEPTEEEILKMLEDGLNLVRHMSDEEFSRFQEEMELKQMKVLERKELINLQKGEIEKIKNHAPAKKGASAMTYLDLLKLEKLMPEDGSKN